MHTLKKSIHIIILLFFSSLLLIACSVEQKQSPPLEITEYPEELVEGFIHNPKNMELPPEYPIEKQIEQQVIEVRPPIKPPLSKSQLFSGVLESHNRVRAKHRLKPLKWSNKLARYSKEWADNLGSGSRCTMRHRSGQPPYGENLYWSSAVVWSNGMRETNRVTIRDVVKVWTDEERWYNYQRNSCQPGQKCGHYTQIVWRDTTEVGCAVKVCNDKSQTWVCSYNPPGNFTGVRPY